MPSFIELLSEESKREISKAGGISVSELNNIARKKRKEKDEEVNRLLMSIIKSSDKYKKKPKDKWKKRK